MGVDPDGGAVLRVGRGGGQPRDWSAALHGRARRLDHLLLSDVAGDLPVARPPRAGAAAAVAGAGARPDLPGVHLLYARIPDGFHGADVLRVVPARLCADDGRAALVMA